MSRCVRGTGDGRAQPVRDWSPAPRGWDAVLERGSCAQLPLCRIRSGKGKPPSVLVDYSYNVLRPQLCGPLV